MDDQAGIVSRRQALDDGLNPADVRRLLRRRTWVALHPGVYVDHTGAPSWLQRAWAGVLHCDGALAGASALRAGDPSRRGDEDLIRLVVPAERRIIARPGLLIERRRDFRAMVQAGSSPRRQRYEDAALDVALSLGDELAALGVLADACGARRTTASRLLLRLAARHRVAGRSWLEQALTDIDRGTCSVLEHEYLARVERAHGLPEGRRQARDLTSQGVVYRDVEYDVGLVVELDGRLAHGSAYARDRDLERDLNLALDGRVVVRLSWGQVHHRPCSTAAKVAMMLTSRGWPGTPTACGPDCAAAPSALRGSTWKNGVIW